MTQFHGTFQAVAGAAHPIFTFVKQRKVSGQILRDGHRFTVGTLFGALSKLHGLVADSKQQFHCARRTALCSSRADRDEQRANAANHGVYPKYRETSRSW